MTAFHQADVVPAAKSLQQPSMTKTFLSAEWRQLAMLNFLVDAKVLKERVPRGTELDFFEGQTFVSIVGFMFHKTLVLGIPVPGHRTFEELNLRFYVRRQVGDESRRGVVFIKELVPRWAVAKLARWAYNENYAVTPMRHRFTGIDGNDPQRQVNVRYEWKCGASWNHLALCGQGNPEPLAANSHEEFIAEHYYGYARQRDGGTVEYRVEHPPWNVWPRCRAEFSCDAERIYGREFADVLSQPPTSAFIAEGSSIIVRRPVRI